MLKNVLIFILFLIVVFIVHILGFLSRRFSDSDFYKNLQKPVFTPPGYVFSIVWATLYILIATSGFLIWKNKVLQFADLTFSFWAVSLFFNMIWTFLFFYLQKPKMALIDLSLIWIFTALFIGFAFNVSAIASILLIPYILWLSFAFILNLKIVLMN
ncbi:MAG: Tryptophan-rich protein TspO [Candidatus Anoxychlamydiales bacterium]|nr:Tryptophan-rich protein TspO [Candidatus Anoxychlamydiales bacterium]